MLNLMKRFDIKWQRESEQEIMECHNLTTVQLIARLIQALKWGRVIIHEIRIK